MPGIAIRTLVPVSRIVFCIPCIAAIRAATSLLFHKTS
jgi:hypothetical protein